MKAHQAHGKAAHVLRKPERAPRKKAAAAPAVDYAPGFFTALMVQHNWPPNFVSSWSRARQYGPQADASRAMREAGVGHAGRPLGLPGSVPYITRPLNFGSLVKGRL